MVVIPFIKAACRHGAPVLGLVALLSMWSSTAAWAQAPASAPPATLKADPPPPVAPPAADKAEKTEFVDPKVEQVGCPTCGGGLLSNGGHTGRIAPVPGCASCGWPGDCGPAGECGCGGPCCKPGRPCCQPCEGEGCIGHCWCRFYNCICCPDPCYEPCWIPAANAGFFVDNARPVNQLTIRYDGLFGMAIPDRAEFFWSAAPKGPPIAERGLNSHDLYMVTEVGSSKFSIVTEVPYRHVEPDLNVPNSGFGDVRIATKTLLLDCELLQFSFQFKTYIPSGTASKGLGIGHTVLEPSLLATAKLTPNLYLQSQLSEWIPIGGDQNVQGSLLHAHFSLNRVLWHPATALDLVGTAEVGGWWFQNGNFTDPATGALGSANEDSFFSAGFGLRLVMCDKMDIGVGVAWGFNSPLIFDQLYRVEWRWRY